MLDAEIAALYQRRDAAGVLPTFAGGPSAAEARSRYAAFQALYPKPDFEVAAIERRTVPGRRGGIPVRVVWPLRPRGTTVVYFHGGGFVVGSADTHLDHATRIAASTGAVVVSVEYALAPEHPFPAAWVDAVDAVEHVMDDPEIGGEADRTAVAGDSAGGNLALGAALHCRDAGRPLLGQLLLYPATDLRLLAAIPSHATVNGFYAGTDPAVLEDPRVSPVLASHTGLPPTVLSVGSEDFLREDNFGFATALERAGVPLRALVHDGLPHGYFHLGAVSRAAEAACTTVVEAFAELLGDATPHRP
ncbi:alpha/beta hydrolase [Saccharopolyspora erythraea]|uniref:alpha/beta hydrolase n=1 Tax=Saccharopolyspora erythraea TaxID=1836 RepID=UPI001BA7A6F9|nr:alpha/beta hydrolase [Saccharopolyspora erythraea]QUH03917.1 alpha/beta hydrolase [Saccharopolyspora erythraea]